jgi:sugar/nucleoside kinase (ribokinase family)
MKYLIISNTIVDDIYFPDNRTPKTGVLGGAAIYALIGAKLWTNEVRVYSGVGEDFFPIYSEWFEKNNLDTEGLLVRGTRTPRSTLRYFEDGDRNETPQFGVEHFKTMEPDPHDFREDASQADAIYIFKDAREEFWKGVAELKEKYDFTLVWEIASNACEPDQLEKVKWILQYVDVFSINMREAIHLFSVRAESQLAEVLQKTSQILTSQTYLRNGKEGAFLITKKNVMKVPSIETDAVDVTGAGNASTAGLMVGLREADNDAALAGSMAAVSGAVTVRQFGPPQKIDQHLRDTALRTAHALREETVVYDIQAIADKSAQWHERSI